MTVNVLNTLLVLTHLKLITTQKIGAIKFHFSDEVKYFAQVQWAHKRGLKPCC